MASRGHRVRARAGNFRANPSLSGGVAGLSACEEVPVRARLAPWHGRPMADAQVRDSPDFLARLRRGDRAAFEDLVIAHQHRVYGLALRMLGNAAEAQEVAQEAFFRAHGGWGSSAATPGCRPGSMPSPPGSASAASRRASVASAGGAGRLGAASPTPAPHPTGWSRKGSWTRRFTGRSPSCRRNGDLGRALAGRGGVGLRGDRGGARAAGRHGALTPPPRASRPQGEAGAVPAMTCQEARESFSALVDDALPHDEHTGARGAPPRVRRVPEGAGAIPGDGRAPRPARGRPGARRLRGSGGVAGLSGAMAPAPPGLALPAPAPEGPPRGGGDRAREPVGRVRAPADARGRAGRVPRPGPPRGDRRPPPPLSSPP